VHGEVYEDGDMQNAITDESEDEETLQHILANSIPNRRSVIASPDLLVFLGVELLYNCLVVQQLCHASVITFCLLDPLFFGDLRLSLRRKLTARHSNCPCAPMASDVPS
jgi:hypothetical protein